MFTYSEVEKEKIPVAGIGIIVRKEKIKNSQIFLSE
jgi:hypothetical protein